MTKRTHLPKYSNFPLLDWHILVWLSTIIGKNIIQSLRQKWKFIAILSKKFSPTLWATLCLALLCRGELLTTSAWQHFIDHGFCINTDSNYSSGLSAKITYTTIHSLYIHTFINNHSDFSDETRCLYHCFIIIYQEDKNFHFDNRGNIRKVRWEETSQIKGLLLSIYFSQIEIRQWLTRTYSE